MSYCNLGIVNFYYSLFYIYAVHRPCGLSFSVTAALAPHSASFVLRTSEGNVLVFREVNVQDFGLLMASLHDYNISVI